MTQQERSLIDRYIDNSLSGVELKDFIDRLENDSEFRKSVSFQNLLIESIQWAEDSRIEKQIVAHINYRKPLIPTGLKLIITFLLITAVGIILWQYVGTGNFEKGRSILSMDIFKKKSEKTEKVRSQEKRISTEEVVAENTSAQVPAEGVEEDNKVSENITTADSANTQTPSGDQDLVVKKDQLMVTHTLKVSELNTEEGKKATDNSMAQTATGKLNPAAGLAENSKSSSDDVEVEFWLSPVNYRGYKLNSNKLILFGIEEPDAVKLYSIDNKLMMKYGQEYFRLNQSDEFVSFSMVKNTDLPAVLR